MGWKIFFGFIFFLIVCVLLISYWIIPFKTAEFGVQSENSNFSLNNNSNSMQFYPNMRYPTSKISYQIYDCSLQKKNDMERAFEIIANTTLLNFYSVDSDEQISVNCDSKTKIEEGLFIAGEGGPTNITPAGNFNVILHGSILLIRDSKCDTPNIAIHELLHTLGFNHSENSNNIMYPISKCGQTIGEDIFNLINELYSPQSYSDLTFENVSAIMEGRYLNLNMSIRNNGLKSSEKAKVIIYANGKFVKEIDLDALEIGYGRKINLENVLVSQINVKELELFIDYTFDELEKNNNRIILKIKNE